MCTTWKRLRAQRGPIGAIQHTCIGSHSIFNMGTITSVQFVDGHDVSISAFECTFSITLCVCVCVCYLIIIIYSSMYDSTPTHVLQQYLYMHEFIGSTIFGLIYICQHECMLFCRCLVLFFIDLFCYKKLSESAVLRTLHFPIRKFGM